LKERKIKKKGGKKKEKKRKKKKRKEESLNGYLRFVLTHTFNMMIQSSVRTSIVIWNVLEK